MFVFVAISGCAVSTNHSAEEANKEQNFYGNYRVGGHMMGIDPFIMDGGERVSLISNYETGVVRRLFRVNETEFVMGPGFNEQNPPQLRVSLIKEEKNSLKGLKLQHADGTTSVATRVPLTSESVFFESADARLSGTLITPATEGPHPAIILLHGSGPLTRYSFGPYPHFFTSLGLAVLIFDKRGTGESTGERMDASTGTAMKSSYYPDDLANDALAALQFLKQHKDIDPTRIGLWGSSEGGMLALYVASKSDEVAFAINSSGFMEPLWKILEYQIGPLLRAAKVSDSVIERQLSFVDLWLKVARSGSGWEEFQKQEEELIKADGFSFFQSRGKYASMDEMRWDWNHVLSFDPQPALAKVRCPVLGLFGEVDPITPAARTAEHMNRILTEAGHKDFEVKVFPGAGHSLSEMPSKNRMAPGVFDTLKHWITKRVF